MADEYIKREDAVELSNDIIRMVEDFRACGAIDYHAYSELFDMLCGFDTIPAGDVRPVVRGKWTLNKDGSGTCSECGKVQKSCWDLDGWDNFCHHCGADMREVQDGDD